MTLSLEQQEVAELSPDAQTLVIADPGTGKTHVLVARLVHLIDRHNLLPGSEILVLSFSRAAVREIRNRLASADTDAKYVAAYTFDSFATRYLSEIDPDGIWKQKDYDGRIRTATDKLTQHGLQDTSLANIRHVMIDEIQDLVGERADFVKAVLKAADSGFTLFGDPAQGIYTWQVNNTLQAVGAKELFDWLSSSFPRLTKHSLTENFRATTDQAMLALWAGPQLNADTPDYLGIYNGLQDNLLSLTSRTLQQAAASLRTLDRTAAILCRTNGQALVISRELYKLNVSHVLQRRAEDRVLPAWLANTLTGVNALSLPMTRFIELVTGHLDEDRDPEQVWRLLKRMNPSGNPNSLDLNTLNLYIRAGQVPDELNERPRKLPVVSTIHRAKGLEFDRVYLAQHDLIADPNDALAFAEEVRVLYVALTRACRDFWHLASPNLQGIHKSTRSERWIKGFNNWQVFEFEVVGNDSHRDDPAGAFLVTDVNPIETQTYIRENVKPGDHLTLWRLIPFPDAPKIFSYKILHQDRIVGITSKDFGKALYDTLHVNAGWVVNWPIVLSGLRVEGIDTVAGTPAAGQNAGLGAHGLWLRVRPGGLAHLTYTPQN